MKTRVISFYNKFECLKGACPDTCCRGWKVGVDDECIECHENNEGFDKFKSLILLNKKKGLFRTALGRCPYETKDGLCSLHKEGRTELMPLICRTYPRRIISFGQEMEVTFELSCPVCAKLFLEAEKLSFIDSKEEIEPVWQIDDHDPSYLLKVKDVRRRMIDYLEKSQDFLSCLDELYSYILALHYNLMFNKFDVIDMEIEDVLNLLGKIDSEKETWAKRPVLFYEARKNPRKALFYEMTVYDKMFSEDVCHEYSKAKRLLKNYIKRYNNCIGDLSVEGADAFVFKKFEDMIAERPQLLFKYKKYLVYQFMQTISACYETYGYFRAYMLSMINLQSMMIMDICDYICGEDLQDLERQTKLLVALEKTHRHNLTTTDNLIKRISDKYV